MLARGVRNVIYNYTDAQRKVRSATSNDAWGPSPALMHEIADLTDNVVAFSEIMPIIWKRLNDHGKNWRHVYKSLVLLDHLIKYGNERVSQQCKENIFAIQTLKDFQYVEDQKDQGFNVREKAKQLVALLKDDERLRNERRKAQEARERYARQAMGMDSSGAVTYGRPANSTSMRRNSAEGGDHFSGTSYQLNSYTTSSTAHRSSSVNGNLYPAASKDFVQPTNQEEEQLQMQIALAESQREAEDEERRRRNDDLKLKIALERSVNEKSPDAFNSESFDFYSKSHPLDPPPFEISHQHNDPYLPSTTSNIGWNPPNVRPSSHLGFTTATNDPWSSEPSDRSSTMTTTATNDPWQIVAPSSTTQANPWTETKPTATNNSTGLSLNIGDPWGLGLNDSQTITTLPPTTTTSKTIDNELSEFFGASATISTSNNHQQQTSSNPWNIPSSNFPVVSNNSGSISPPNTGLNTGGSLLYPTLASGNNSNSNNPSPLPSAILASRKTPESFLGENFSNLVNLDKLVTDTKTTNPFGSTATRAQNPFANLMKPPTLDQLSSSNNTGFTSGSPLPPPLIPSSFNTTTSTINTNNPFM
ncbi:unnamed protein product [Rotaria sp. Silwood1]|nr:unnamed protein product [Rotaria sp. Silwood1]CAF0892505.1 unnamed protein product [Rotaria sp. Silwood1]CAF0906375.1 unnamed protein product [Rotaria sp. Silwood1]CAF3351602.1 unnamed protein product [Rotaria sp. Silwood1]CAF3379095.1 unnamed protein product [Rotaria sp. Silwood1]